MRMIRFLEHTFSTRQNIIQTSDVSVLGMLSDQLSQELSYEMHASCLKEHLLFKYVSEHMKSMAYTICHMLKSQLLATGDVIFTTGEEASRTFIIKNGSVDYHIT